MPIPYRLLTGTCELEVLAADAPSCSFVLQGEVPNDNSGFSVSSAGDINGDGLSDLLIGAYNATPLRKWGAGKTYLIFGSSNITAWGNGTLSLSSLINGQQGFVLQGEAVGDKSGRSVSSAGDINGDGLSDLLIGACNATPLGKWGAGKTYLIFGSSNITAWGNGTLGLSSLINGLSGFVLQGEAPSDNSGFSVSSAGDINGDGISDVLIGAPWATPPLGKWGAGKTYLIFGSSNITAWDNGALNLSSLVSRGQGFVLQGEAAYDNSGYSVSSAGDINGDGLSDLLIGAPYAAASGQSFAGKTYLIFGSRNTTAWGNGTLNLSSLINGRSGFVLQGEAEDDYSGFSVSSAGDINGDGLSDLLIGAYQASLSGKLQVGKTYLVFGSQSTTAWDNGALNLSSLINGRSGFLLQGEAAYDYSGYSVSSAGDINGDGFADLLIGSRGRSYVVFGSTTVGESGIVELSRLNGNNGFKINKETQSDSGGFSVAFAGDINGDAQPDILLGDYSYSSNRGRSYLMLGAAILSQSPTSLSLPAPSPVQFLTNSPSRFLTQAPTLPSLSPSLFDPPTPLSGQSPNSLPSEDSGMIAGLAITGLLIPVLLYVVYRWFKKRSASLNQFKKTQEEQTPFEPLLPVAPILHSQNMQLLFPLQPFVERNSGKLNLQSAGLKEKNTFEGIANKALAEPMGINLEPSNTSSSCLMDEVGTLKISFTIAFKDLEFKEEGKLGEGAYGTVYKGKYKYNEVAIKKLHAKHFSQAALEEFKQEAGIMARMRSDYIVQLRGVCFEEPHYCMVMELMPKGSLYHLLKNSPELSLALRYRIGLDVAYALYQLHDASVLHCDLKSLNVLLDDRLRAKVADFGLSKMKSELGDATNSTKGMKGTLGWIAPELFEEKPIATPAADLYAYGMILWELVTKPYRTPFQGLAPASLVTAKTKRGTNQETLSEDCPANYAGVVRSCWQPAEKRPSAHQVVASLSALWKEAEAGQSARPSINSAALVNPPVSLHSESLAYEDNLMSDCAYRPL